MSKKVLLNNLEELLELDENTLEGNEPLSTLEEWSSIGMIGFIAMVDENYNLTVSPSDIHKALTVNDLCKLIPASVDA